MNKLSMIVLLTGIVVLLIGSNYSWAQKEPAGTDFFHAKFNKKDTDGDGKISRNEHMEYSKKLAEKNFTRMDLNKDGFISREDGKVWTERRKKAKGKAKEQRKGKEQ